MKRIGAMVAVALLGCATEDEDTSTAESPIIDTTSPFFGPPAALPVMFPALPAHGKLPEAADFANTSFMVAHSASYSNGVDLGPPLENRASYSELIDSAPRDWYLQAPHFTGDLRAAMTAADAHMGELSLTALQAAGDLLSYVGFHAVPEGPTQQFAGYPIPRARWLDAQWARAPGAGPLDAETRYTYPAPYGLRAFPERGARLYCAAREVARNQTSGSLGRQVLLPLSVLGQSIDIGVFEPTAFVNQPERIPDTYPGDQAFNVPFKLGIQITPVSPILPSLPELRYPLVLSTADSEIMTNVGRGLIVEDKRCVSFFGTSLCVPIVRDDYRFRYRTFAHADTAISTGASMSGDVSVPVFWAGPLLVSLEVGLAASVGKAIPDSSARGFVSDDRLLFLANPPVPWAPSHREGAAYEKYLDGFWFGQSFAADGVDESFDIEATDDDHNTSFAGSVTMTPMNPLRPMVHANDDHHVAPTSEIKISGGLSGLVGFDASIVTLQIKAKGDVSGTLGLAHDVRDGVNAFTGIDGSPRPIAGVTITPVTYGHADLHFNVNFHLHISLPWPLDDIDVNYDIIDSTTPLASFQNTWGDGHKLRIGTESTLGDPTQAPSVPSQIGSALFPSFPPSTSAGRMSVNGCLADTTSVPAPPPPCSSRPPAGPPPETSNCVYMEILNQLDPCMNIPLPTNGASKRQDCDSAMLTYMCGPVSKQQYFDNGTTGLRFVLAHKLDIPRPPNPLDLHSPAPDLGVFAAAVVKCAEADAADGLIPTGSTGPSDWFKARFTAASCDASATLYKASEIVTSTGKPGAVTAGSCH